MTLTKPSLVDYASQFVELRRNGKELTGPCPICKAGDDRFNIRSDRSGWLCRHCTPRGGGVFDLIAKIENITVEQAMANHRAQTVKPSKTPKATSTPDCESPDWQSKAKRMVDAAAKNLPGSPAMEYLLKRGIDIETARKFQLGYNPNWPTRFEKQEGRTEVTETAPCVVVPWIRNTGKICALKMRLIGDRAHGDRFRQLKGGHQAIFGEHLITPSPNAILVEGEFNAISLSMCDLGANVLSFGGDTNTSEILSIATTYQRILVWLDNPERVKNFQDQLSVQQNQRVTYMVSPEAIDANDMLTKYSLKFLREFVSRIAPWLKQ